MSNAGLERWPHSDSHRPLLLDGFLHRLAARRHFRPPSQGCSRWAPRTELPEHGFRRITSTFIILVGAITWLLAAPHWPIIQALFISGPLVGSLIWPVIAGLYWKKINRYLVLTGIIVGSALGVAAYFTLGWFTASLVGAAVSMIFTLLARVSAPQPYPESPAS